MKRACDDVKTWWEHNFDTAAFKFARIHSYVPNEQRLANMAAPLAAVWATPYDHVQQDGQGGHNGQDGQGGHEAMEVEFVN